MPQSFRAFFVRWHRYFGFCIFCFTMAAITTGIMDRQYIYIAFQKPATLAGPEFNLANSTAVVFMFVSFIVFAVHRQAPAPKREDPFAEDIYKSLLE
jgi:hypothetical protein